HGYFSIDRVEFIHTATGHLHGDTSCSVARERPVVIGFEAEFDEHHVFSEDHILHDVTVSSKSGDKGANKLISKGRLTIYEHSRKLHRHVFGVVGQNAVLVGASPGLVILIDKRADVTNGSKGNRSSHKSPPRSGILTPFACAMHHQMGSRGRLGCDPSERNQYQSTIDAPQPTEQCCVM